MYNDISTYTGYCYNIKHVPGSICSTVYARQGWINKVLYSSSTFTLDKFFMKCKPKCGVPNNK